MKNNTLIIFVIVLLTICVVILSGLLFLGISNNSNRFIFNFKNRNKVLDDLVFDEEYEKEFNKIVINAEAANIEIRRSNKNQLVVYGEKDLLEVRNEKDLYVNYDAKPCKFFCLNINLGKIILYLEEDFQGLIEIKNDYGDIEIEEFLQSEIKIESSYGDTKVDGVKTLTADSSAGTIEIGTVTDAKINNNYGDIKIDLVDNKADINADCGNIKIKKMYIKENSNINNNFGDIKIESTSDVLIEADVSLGDKKINNNNYKSDIILKIENNCGDIKVNQ